MKSHFYGHIDLRVHDAEQMKQFYVPVLNRSGRMKGLDSCLAEAERQKKSFQTFQTLPREYGVRRVVRPHYRKSILLLDAALRGG